MTNDSINWLICLVDLLCRTRKLHRACQYRAGRIDNSEALEMLKFRTAYGAGQTYKSWIWFQKQRRIMTIYGAGRTFKSYIIQGLVQRENRIRLSQQFCKIVIIFSNCHNYSIN
jgi:hypothetical protein